MSGVKVDIKNYFPQIMREFIEGRTIALEAIGQKAEDYAKRDAPIDTGRLTMSIQHNSSEKAVVIGTNVKYAKYVEYIDRYHHNNGKAHFLRDAMSTHDDEYIRIIIAALNSR